MPSVVNCMAARQLSGRDRIDQYKVFAVACVTASKAEDWYSCEVHAHQLCILGLMYDISDLLKYDLQAQAVAEQQVILIDREI